MAEAGCGIPEKFCMLPKVSRGRRTLNKPVGCDMVAEIWEERDRGFRRIQGAFGEEGSSCRTVRAQ